MRNFVECCLGGDVPLPDMSVTARNKLEAGDMLLACTDGLWSGLEDNDFADASREDRTSIEQVVRKLADRAVAANAPHSDNTSVAAACWRGA
jgi:serine/threonine protein phosphatase PrpC